MPSHTSEGICSPFPLSANGTLSPAGGQFVSYSASSGPSPRGGASYSGNSGRAASLTHVSATQPEQLHQISNSARATMESTLSYSPTGGSSQQQPTAYPVTVTTTTTTVSPQLAPTTGYNAPGTPPLSSAPYSAQASSLTRQQLPPTVYSVSGGVPKGAESFIGTASPLGASINAMHNPLPSYRSGSISHQHAGHVIASTLEQPLTQTEMKVQCAMSEGRIYVPLGATYIPPTIAKKRELQTVYAPELVHTFELPLSFETAAPYPMTSVTNSKAAPNPILYSRRRRICC